MFSLSKLLSGSGSGIHKMASSLDAAFGVAIPGGILPD